MENELSEKIFLTDIKNHLRSKDHKICFILGAGASANAGIMTGAGMAKFWYSQLDQVHDSSKIEEWKRDVNFDEKNISEFYSQLFSFYYSRDQQAGIQFINDEIEQGKYSIGHILLAQLLTSTPNNVVITTNFDTLIEEAIYNTTYKRPLVCSHEAVANYATPKAERPLIIKIHRDRYMDPMNNESDTNLMKFEWAEPLNKVFENFLPIVIGYGGNDGSLMNYLAGTKKIKRLYWCKRKDSFIARKTLNVLKNTNGYLVNIHGFDELMLSIKNIFDLVPTAGFVSDNIQQKNKKIIEQINLLEIRRENQDIEDFRNQAVVPVDKDNWLYWQSLAESKTYVEDAISVYTDALNRLPNNYNLHYNMAVICMQAYITDKALWHLNRTIRLNPLYSEAYYNLGVLHFNRGERNLAIKYYLDAVNINPDKSDAWFNLGKMYSEDNHNELAIEAYMKAYERGNNYKAASNLGFVYKTTGNLNDAVKYFKKALEIEPNDYITLNNLGSTYSEMGNSNDAINCLTRALVVNPQYYTAYLNLGDAYRKIQDYKRAAFSYNQALQIAPFYKPASDALDEIRERL